MEQTKALLETRFPTPFTLAQIVVYTAAHFRWPEKEALPPGMRFTPTLVGALAKEMAADEESPLQTQPVCVYAPSISLADNREKRNMVVFQCTGRAPLPGSKWCVCVLLCCCTPQTIRQLPGAQVLGIATLGWCGVHPVSTTQQPIILSVLENWAALRWANYRFRTGQQQHVVWPSFLPSFSTHLPALLVR